MVRIRAVDNTSYNETWGLVVYYGNISIDKDEASETNKREVCENTT